MRIVVIGGEGLIGGAVARALEDEHDVVRVGRSSGDVRADMASSASLDRLFDEVGEVDAVVCAAGGGTFKPLLEASDDELLSGVRDKLMGQVNVIRAGLRHLPENGSVTVTSGVLSVRPVEGAAAIAMANAGLEAVVRVAALEAPRGIRVNAVSPGWVAETLENMGRDPSEGTPADEVARAYVSVVRGRQQGEVVEP